MAEHKAKAEESYKFLRSLLEANDWKDEGVQKGVKVSKRQHQSSPIAMFKGEKVVPGSPKTISETFFTCTTKTLNKWDSTFAHYEPEVIIEAEGEEQMQIDYMISSLPWPVWGRDFVLLNGRRIIEDTAYHYHTSTDVDTKPPEPNKYVRGHITLSGFAFGPADGQPYETSQSTKIVRILHVEPKGSIPGWLINTQATKQIADFVNNLATLATGNK